MKRWAIKDFQRTNRYQSCECSFPTSYFPRKSKNQTLPIGSRESLIWIILKTSHFVWLTGLPVLLYHFIIFELRPPRRTPLGLGFLAFEPNGRDVPKPQLGPKFGISSGYLNLAGNLVTKTHGLYSKSSFSSNTCRFLICEGMCSYQHQTF